TDRRWSSTSQLWTLDPVWRKRKNPFNSVDDVDVSVDEPGMALWRTWGGRPPSCGTHVTLPTGPQRRRPPPGRGPRTTIAPRSVQVDLRLRDDLDGDLE